MINSSFRNLRPPLSIILIPVLLFNLIGCSCFRSGTQNFNVTVTPSDAQIYVNNAYKGTGNVKTRVPSDKPVTVRVTKEGYTPLSRMVEKKLSVTGVLDTIGGWLIIVPFIGLAFPGAYELENSNLCFKFSDSDKLKKGGGEK